MKIKKFFPKNFAKNKLPFNIFNKIKKFSKKSTNKITWVRCFSWEDTPNLSVKSQNWLLTHSLDLSKFSEYITPLIQKEWHRKQFDDFSYLSIEISDGQYIALLIMILLYNIGISIWLVKNDFRNE